MISVRPFVKHYGIWNFLEAKVSECSGSFKKAHGQSFFLRLTKGTEAVILVAWVLA